MNDQTAEQPPTADPAPAAEPPRQRLRDRAWSLRSVIAVALASVILGGLGGAAVAGFADGDDGRRGPGNARFERGGPDGPPGLQRWRERQRMKEWMRERREGSDHRPWDRQGPPGPAPTSPPPASPTPAPPTPTS